MQIALSTTDVAKTGRLPVVGTNPAAGAGPSSAVNFTVLTGTPTRSFTATVSASSGQLTHLANLSSTVQ